MAATALNGQPPAAPTVALVHDDFAGPTGMGLVVNHHAHWVLEAGWRLCIVGDNIPDDLRTWARVIPALKPHGLPALPEHLEWCRRARAALRRARADIVHVHSPLLAEGADIQTAHFICRPAFARGIREPANGVEGALRRVQAWATRRLDDRLYQRVRSRTYLSFVSGFLRDEFERHYGPPSGGWIFSPPAPPWQPPPAEERAHARAALGVPEGALVTGYLGGNDPRKGFEDVLTLASESDMHLLFAGPGSERIKVNGRPGLGFVDVASFLSACDVLAAPARFDSAPVAVLQSLARGVPVVTGAASGWARAIERHRCGVVWRGGSMPLADACRLAAGTPAQHCRGLVEELAPARQREALLGAYEQILARRAIAGVGLAKEAAPVGRSRARAMDRRP
jgi:glycosyltransferase involved in cell wall biosynthesis